MPSTSPSSTSILRATQQCIQFFRRGLPRSSRGMLSPLDPGSQAILENQMGRFKIWAGNIGVFAAGTACTDYRLRQDQDIRGVMIQMLARLKKHLEQLISLSSLQEEGSQEDSGSESTDSPISSSPSLVISLGSDSNSNSNSSTGDTSEAQEKRNPSHDRLNAIDDIITSLYRLSAIIRKPISIDEVTKVENFIAKNQESTDTKEFVSRMQWYTQFRHPAASATLIDRLVSSIVFRRHKLLYRERHHEKLSQGVEQAFALGIEESDRPYPSNTKQNENDSGRKPHGKSRFLIAPTIKSSSQTIPYSATEASLVNRLGFSSNPRSIALSGMTRSAVSRREQLDVPPPPRRASKDEETVCPYCFEVIDGEKMKHALWTRHVLKDIDPYICLFEDCNQPNEHFKNVEDWMNHMKWQHTIAWSCQACSHKSAVFDSKTKFEQHLLEKHHNTFTESQLPMIVQKSAHPASDTFSILTARNNDTAFGSRYECPLCEFFVEKAGAQKRSDSTLLGAELPTNEASKIIQNHIAAHLESLALLSLPEQDVLDEDFSMARESEVSKNSTRQDNNTFEAFSLQAELEEQQPDSAYLVVEDLSPDEAIPASDPETTEDTWACVFDSLGSRKKSDEDFEPAQDVNLRGFVERARYIQMIKSWKFAEIPVLIIHDPDGIEIAFYNSKDVVAPPLSDNQRSYAREGPDSSAVSF